MLHSIVPADWRLAGWRAASATKTDAKSRKRTMQLKTAIAYCKL